ncbi:MAG TPA: phage holin family protein [Jatrophihabitans sp.]|nr:phage holin family protein [Jatrophihabitans sp.]
MATRSTAASATKRASASSAKGAGPDLAAALVDDGPIADGVSLLIRQELDRAKTELKKELRRPGKRPAMFAGSAFAAYMTVFFASIAVWWGLSNVMDEGLAALIVTAVWAVVCAGLYAAGKRSPMTRRSKG